MIRHHPDDALLLAHAAGTLHGGAALLVVTHLTLCPDCRRAVAEAERIGGAMLDALPAAPVSAAARARVFARLDAPVDGPSPTSLSAGGPPPKSEAILPAALRRRLGEGNVARLPWRRVMPGLEEIVLEETPEGGRTRLMRIRAGRAVPRHTHVGTELVCVLAGGFTDDAGHFGRGDVGVSDGTVDHRPVADGDADCVCLAVTEAPVRLTGRLGRLVNRFVRY